MNFFKSVFSDESTPLDSPKSEPESPALDSDSQTHSTADATDSTWSFGGLIKTIATKSESMIETYRKDIEELGSGLRKETAVIRDVASRAVKDLPASFEVGASVAQESLETVGQAVDDIGATVWKSTAQIISHGKVSILPSDDYDYDDSDKNQQSSNLKRYSRFDMQLNAIECDFNTYCNEPEDKVDYEEWRRLGFFYLEEKKLEIASLISENRAIKQIYDEVVPSRVDEENFWSRYFYKVHTLKKAEEARALLLKKAISGEEDLRWDFEDEDEDDNVNNGETSGCENEKSEGNLNEKAKNKLEKPEVEKAEVKGDNRDSGKDSDVSVVSSRQSLLPEKDDLGWDEIEEIDESKGEATSVGSVASSRRIDLHKRLSAAEEEEDLGWDIDDEDGETKKP